MARARPFASATYLAFFVLVSAWPVRALDAEAVAAARLYFEDVDNEDYAAAYDRFSVAAKAVISYPAWLETTRRTGPAMQRRFDKTVVYDTSNGRFVAVEFEALNRLGDRVCGYTIVDADGFIVRVETNVIPEDSPADLRNAMAANPGCDQ